MTTIKTLLMPKLYQDGELTLRAKTGDLRVYVDRFLDGSGWQISIEEKIGKYYDSDYKQFIDTWTITKQIKHKTADEVISSIDELFNNK